MKLKLISCILILSSLVGCVSSKSQHYHLKDYEEFRDRDDRSVTNANHWKWDRDVLRRMNDRQYLLETIKP